MPDPSEPTANYDAPDPGATRPTLVPDVGPLLNFGRPAADGEVGTLGPYRVVKELGAGGMGVVYLALDTRLGRKLALKVMRPEFASSRGAKERFLREARAAAQIAHDHVVTVYEADERGGVPYIAMQFLQGYPLDEYLKRKGAPTVAQAVKIGYEAALGLGAAHALGLVHRDVKPANLWLEAPHGRVKLLDFGLAKPLDGDAELTRNGALVGSPAYMSPEQARGEKVDQRTDLFSLGALLYRLVTGRNPFRGKTVAAVLMSLGSDNPAPVRDLNPDVPEPIAELIHQLLAKDTDLRPQTATEVAERLRAVLERPPEVPVATAVPDAPAPVADAPLQVTVAPHSAFADLDETSAERWPPAPAGGRTADAKPLWIATGVAVLAAAVAVGVVLMPRRKPDAPERTDAPPQVAPAAVLPPVKPPAPIDADRKAAQELKPFVHVHLRLASGKVVKTVPTEPLPDEPFTVTQVDVVYSPTFHDRRLSPRFVKDVLLPAVSGLRALEGVADDYDKARFGDDDIVRMAEMPFAHRITHLPPCPYTPAVRPALKNFPLLSSFNVRARGLGDAELEALAKELPTVSQLGLHELGVEAAVGERGFTAVAQLPLTVLRCKDSPAVDARFAAAIATMPKLTSLSVRGADARDGWAGRLVECRELRQLIFNSCHVTDADVEKLATLPRLNHLGLDSCPQVSDAGIAHLAAATQLTKLSLSHGTPVTERAVRALQDSLPNCTVTWAGKPGEPAKK